MGRVWLEAATLVAWAARKLKFIPLSSCEAEVAALVMMLKEAKFVMGILRDMHAGVECPVPCITDSKSGRDIIMNPGVTKHTAHFERWLHYAREEYLKGWSNIYLTVTDLMMADIATKPLSEKNKFLKCRAFQLNE